MPSKAPPVWVEIDLDAIANNVRELRRIVNPSAELMAVVKADAYGHGAVQAAGVALQNGATRLGVARLDEGEALRRAGFEVPILIFGYTDPQDFGLVIESHLTQTIYSLQMAEVLSREALKAGKTATVHIKIDSGMNRLGFIASTPEAVKDILQISRMPGLDLEGVYTHFAKADFRDKDHATEQWERFITTLGLLAVQGLTFRCRHADNSAATVDMPSTHLDMVRPGLAIYGYYPNQEDLEKERKRLHLLPAMRWKAIVSHVKRVQAGTGVGYGIIYTTGDDTTIATIPVGYGDGYNRLLSNRGEVLIHGQRCPVIGRVCMDQIMVDANGVPGLKVGDEVVLIGSQGGEEITVEEIASKLDTIPHEVTCGVAARVPRHYLGAGSRL